MHIDIELYCITWTIIIVYTVSHVNNSFELNEQCIDCNILIAALMKSTDYNYKEDSTYI